MRTNPPPQPRPDSPAPLGSPAPAAVAQPRPYGAPFWFLYAANFLVLAMGGVLYHYADFITFLGGTELSLGWIGGTGMLGSLLMRFALGQGIDRYGPRSIVLGSLSLLAASSLAHLLLDNPTGVAIYLLRIGYWSAIAGYVGGVLTYISGLAPPARMVEMLSTFGTSGLMGPIAGAWLGDYLRGSGDVQLWNPDRMFLAAAALAAAALPLVWLALRGHFHPPPVERPSLRQLRRTCHPGTMLVVLVVVAGAGLKWPETFLAKYVAELHFTRISLFVTVCFLVALLTRISTRAWSQKVSLRTMMLLGAGGLALSQLVFLLVTTEWWLALPGAGYGMSQAVLFPASIAAGNVRVPEKHRGLATTLMLAMWDVGSLLGMPAAGMIIHYSDLAGLPPYPALFLAMGLMLGLAVAGYAVATRHWSPLAAEPA